MTDDVADAPRTHPLTCMRKRRYASEQAALGVVYKMRARHQDTERLAPYRCDCCKHWHLGRRGLGAPA